MIVPQTNRIEKILLLIWFLVYLGMGIFTVHQYGISIDEPNNYRYADATLNAYPSFFGTLYEPQYDSSFDGHGPAYVTVVAILVKLIQRIFPNVFAPDLWHFSYFITFLLTGLCLYWLARRWFSPWTAWGLLLLFSTQPLLLGHAFVNPKDIPFMFLFTLSIVLGFRLVDRMGTREPSASLEGPVKALIDRFRQSNPRLRNIFIIALALLLIAVLALVLFASQINGLTARVVTFFYTADPTSWAGRIFALVASRSAGIPAEAYISKVDRLFHRAEAAVLLSALILILAYFGLLINNLSLSTFLRGTWRQRYKLKDFVGNLAIKLRRSFRWSALKNWFSEVFQGLRNPYLLLAGITLGFATGLRGIAPWAGVIVMAYLWTKVPSRRWTTAAAYFLVAGIVTYLVWPHLWGAPVQRYLGDLGIISAFPDYPQQVIFNGRLYGDTDLPRSYLPILMNIQFTEPVLLSFYIGLGVLAWRFVHSHLRIDLLLYVGMGFVIPLFGLILLDPPLYNNFRQVLFLAPAMFMVAAFTLELVFSKLTQNWVRVLLIAAVAFPGVYSTIKLYPYEYIYYNSLVGGAAGAHDRFELDYLRISLREASYAINKIAPPKATIVVTRSAGLFVNYSRPDLVVDKSINSILNLGSGYDYSVQLARGRKWDVYPDAKTVVLIERDGAVLAVAKDMKQTNGK